MNKIARKNRYGIYIKYTYEFYFENELENDVDYFMHEFTREVTDEFSAISYGLDWLLKYEDKFGYCVAMKIYETDHSNNVLCWVEDAG